MKRFLEQWNRWKGLVPGAAVAGVVAVSLAVSNPALAEVPALATPQPAAGAAAEQTAVVTGEKLDKADGTYTGKAAGYGGDIEVRVSVQDGAITAIDVLDAEGETDSFFARARTILPKMIEANTWEVDGVSGATFSSNGLKNAVQNALTGKSQTKAVVKLGNLSKADGVYTGTAAGFGGDIKVNVTVESGAITAVDIAEAEGETFSYFVRARKVVEDVIESNSWAVDTVTGATYSSRGILNAVQNALTGESAAETVQAGPIEVEDGEYEGTGTGYGGDIKVRVTVESGKIAAVDILEAKEETASFFVKARKVISSVVENSTWEVDTVSGATYSSKGILQAVQNALTGGSTAKSEVKNQGSLKKADGRYIGTAEGYGGEIKVRVTVQDGNIVGVDILEAEKETESYFNKARKVLDDVKTANSWKVDTVTGATYSSKGILKAIQNAIEGASATPTPTPSGKTYTDGVYLAEAEGYGGPIQLRVTISDGQILAIDIVSAEDETFSYLNHARKVIDSILAAQSAEVDTVSGATYSSGAIREAVQLALAQAEPTEPTPSPEPTPQPSETPTPEPTPQPSESPNPTPSENPQPSETPGQKYADGTYTGTAVCTNQDESDEADFDYDVTVTFLVENGLITNLQAEVTQDRLDDPSTYKSYIKKAIEGKNGTPGIPEQIMTAQSADQIDAVSRATYSSYAIQAAVQNALAAGPREGGEQA